MYLLADIPYTAVVNSNIVITVVMRRHLSLRLCLLRARSFCSIMRVPLVQLSLSASTLTSGVPSARQNPSSLSS